MQKRINQLITFLIEDKHYEDLERSARDDDFHKQLMQQYGIDAGSR